MNPVHLEQLQQLAASLNVTIPFWLEDLVLNGPRYELRTLPNCCLNRMFLTEFLARWLKAAGASQERALEWLLAYCCEVLAEFSKTGPSGIRHGTKSNTRWVYNSDFFFDFDAIASHPPAPECSGRPAYMPVFDRWYELLAVEKEKARQLYVAAPRIEVSRSVKTRHREKFELGLKLAREKQAAGGTLAEIVKLLNEHGYPTCTGRKWTESTLHRWLRNKQPVATPSPSAS